MYSVLVANNEHKKPKGVNENLVATISHDGYKHILLNTNCIRHSMNRIQVKGNKIGTNEINKVSLSFLMANYIFKAMDMTD